MRPEALEIEAALPGHAVVAERTFLGSFTRMRVTLDDGADLLVDVASRRGLPEPGARVDVRVLSDDALVSSGEPTEIPEDIEV